MDIALISGIISLAAYILYIYTIWFGSTRPSRSSWWILTVVWTVLLLSSLSLTPGATLKEQFLALPGGWLTLSYIAGSLVIAISTLWRGSSDKWGIFDYMCALFASLSLVLYFVSGIPFLALVMAVIADLFGILPTMKNAWLHPDEEDLKAWVLESIASILALFGISTFFFTAESFAAWSPVVYLVIVNVIITLFITRIFGNKKTS